MTYPRLEELKQRVLLLQPYHTEDKEYRERSSQILDLVMDKVLGDVSALINHEPKEIPEALDSTIALMTSDFIQSFGLFDTAEEKADKEAMAGIKGLTEGDTSVTYQGGNSVAISLSEALRANSVTGNYKRTLLHYRKLAR